MNEAALAKLATLLYTGLTIYTELQRGLELLRRAQAEGREITDEELASIKSLERLAAEREEEVIRQAEGDSRAT